MQGRYIITGRLGEGGMGLVLRAYDPKLQREVALKVLKPGRFSDDLRSRMVREARAMAKLSHPNVVSVYDVELDGNAVVLSMELIDGATIDRWQEIHQLSPLEAVQLYLQAGRGLAAAHRAGLLHRDFKPGNVLVSKEGTAKVTDFGIARLDEDRTSLEGSSMRSSSSGDVLLSQQISALQTEAGTVLGTPRYMAPEQFRTQDIDASVDQYAFCVALWQALVGELPFGREGGSARKLREAKETGPPPWPPGSKVPHPWVEAIRRGLDPDPRARWPSMDALLEALSYDPRRRRNRMAVGVLSVGMLGFGAVSWNAWAQARAQRCSGAEQQLVATWDEARSQEMRRGFLGLEKAYVTAVWERTKLELDAYAADWVAMHSEVCEATTVRGEQSAAVMDLRMRCLHRARVSLDATVRTLVHVDDTVAQNAHRLIAGLPPLSRCADVEALSDDVEPPLPGEAQSVERIRAHLAEAKAEEEAGRYEPAHQAVQAARSALSEVEYGPVHTEVALQYGSVLSHRGQYEDSEKVLSDAIQYASQWGQWELLGLAATQLMYVVGYHQLQMEGGLRYAKLAKGLARGARRQAQVANDLGSILQVQGKHEEAEAQFLEALGLVETVVDPLDPATAPARNNLANVLGLQGRFAEAEVHSRRVVEVLEQALGADHPNVALARNNLANFQAEQGKHEEAETELRRMVEILQEALGPDHPHVGLSRINLAIALSGQEKDQAAEVEFRKSLEILESALGPVHPHVTMARQELTSLLLGRGRAVEALELAEDAWVHRQQDGLPHELRAETAFLLARTLWAVHLDTPQRTRAWSLAHEALNTYRQLEDPQVERVKEIQDWLNERPSP